jgi:hypothetical protein
MSYSVFLYIRNQNTFQNVNTPSSPVDSKSKTKGKDMKDGTIWRYDEKNMKMTEMTSGDNKMGLTKQERAKNLEKHS